MMDARADYFRRKTEVATESKRKVADNWKAKLADPITLFTGILAILALLQFLILAKTDDTLRDTMIEASRAWIAPLHISLVSGVDDPAGPKILLHYQNVGRSPALDMKIGMGPIAVDIDAPMADTREFPKTPLWDAMWPQVRDLCKKQEPISGAQAVYANPTIESSAPSRMTTSWDKDKLLSGHQIIVVNACLAYRTMTLVGHSGFCSFLFHISGQPNDTWEIRSCPIGNFAD